MTTQQQKALARLWNRSEAAYAKAQSYPHGSKPYRRLMDLHCAIIDQHEALARSVGSYHDGTVPGPIPGEPCL